MTWEMDLRIMEKAAIEKGRREGKAAGIREGKAAGIREGTAKGRREGKEEGKKEEREAMAATMIKAGEPLAKIKTYTKLTEAAIHKIAKTMGAAVL